MYVYYLFLYEYARPKLLLNQMTFESNEAQVTRNSPQVPIHYEKREQDVMNWIVQMDLHTQVLSLQKETQICGNVLFAMKCIMKKIQKIGCSVGVEDGLMNYT